MQRWFAALVLAAGAMSASLAAHFVFVVPQPDGRTALVFINETLQPSDEVDIGLIAGTTLSLRGLDGRETPLTLAKGKQALTVQLPSAAPGVVHGFVDLGVRTEGSVPNVLRYYPKTIVGDAFDSRTRLHDLVQVEIIPVRDGANLRLQLLAKTKPLPFADITVLSPNGTSVVIKTDDQGRTATFAALPGRYGAWARYWEMAPGDRDGKKYEQLRHYATLVFDVTGSAPAPAAGATPAPTARFSDAANTSAPAATPVATMPEATSSFGAVASDGWLYVYGGHIAPTHVYSTEAVSGRFHRLNLADGKTWEALPSGPAMQGMNLVAYRGRIYRVGGMQPQNKPGDKEDTRSLADVARYDPAARAWESLPSLPAPRSSHDVVIIDDTLIVVGGWNLTGKDGKPEWAVNMDTLDLSASPLAWKTIPQPFKTRALIAAATAGKLYVLGGFTDKSEVVRSVAIYDFKHDRWAGGPNLPGGPMNGFGPAAGATNGELYVSIDDGSVHRLNETGQRWDFVGRATARSVHRLVPDGRRLLVLGGASRGGNSDLVESIPLKQARPLPLRPPRALKTPRYDVLAFVSAAFRPALLSVGRGTW